MLRSASRLRSECIDPLPENLRSTTSPVHCLDRDCPDRALRWITCDRFTLSISLTRTVQATPYDGSHAIDSPRLHTRVQREQIARRRSRGQCRHSPQSPRAMVFPRVRARHGTRESPPDATRRASRIRGRDFPVIDALTALVREAQETGHRLTLTVQGNVTTCRWSRGRGRRADMVINYATPELFDVVEELAQRVLPQENQ
jgi:hypothetical protein